MGILVNQTAARLIFVTGVDFNNYDVTTKLIYYEKPDGAQGSWTPTILSGGETAGKLYIDFNSEIYFDQIGVWRFWSYLVFSDGRTAQGEVTTYKVYDSEQIL